MTGKVEWGRQTQLGRKACISLESSPWGRCTGTAERSGWVTGQRWYSWQPLPRVGLDAAGKDADGALLGPWYQTMAPDASC